MTALERVLELKKQGKQEREIVQTLRSENYSPLKISDALNQSKIKEAIVDSNPTAGMSPSIMDEQEENDNTQMENTTNQEQTSQENYYTPEPEPEQPLGGYTPQTPQQNMQDPYSQYGQTNDYSNNYPDFSAYDNSYSPDQGYGESSTDTIIEISEQVFLEKTKNLMKQMKEFEDFKRATESKISDIDERLKRMEKNFDKMQLSILDKVSEYGKGLDYLRKEMNIVGDSISKFSKEK